MKYDHDRTLRLFCTCECVIEVPYGTPYLSSIRCDRHDATWYRYETDCDCGAVIRHKKSRGKIKIRCEACRLKRLKRKPKTDLVPHPAPTFELAADELKSKFDILKTLIYQAQKQSEKNESRIDDQHVTINQEMNVMIPNRLKGSKLEIHGPKAYVQVNSASYNLSMAADMLDELKQYINNLETRIEEKERELNVISSGIFGKNMLEAVETVERSMLIKAHQKYKGNKAEICRQLKMAPGTVRSKLAQYQIE